MEDCKERLLDAIIKMGRTTGMQDADIERLEAAKKETQFSKAIDDVKEVIPESLYIAGQNPLTLLHGPLSAKLHAGDDEECLKQAHLIRKVLYALVERIAQIAKDHKDITNAVNALRGSGSPDQQ